MITDERYHPLVEGTNAAMFVFDMEKILYINPAARGLTGRTARDLLGRPFLSLVHPRFRAQYEAPAALAATSRKQVQILRRDGGSRWIELSLQPILFRGAAATLATAIDIDDLKRAELARRDAEVQLKLVQRAGRTVSWDWRVGDDELTVYGLPPDLVTEGAPTLKTTGRAFLNQLGQEDLLDLKQALRQSLNNGDPLFLEVAARSPKGQVVWLLLRGQPVFDDTGVARHMVGVATDVTDRRQVEEKLEREQEHALAMLASVSDGMIRTDLSGGIVDLSESAETLTGTTLDQVRGKALRDVLSFVDKATGEVLEDPVERCLAADAPLLAPRTCMIRRADDEDVPVRYHAALLSDQNSEPIGVVVVLRDLIEQRKAEHSMVYLATHDPLTDLLNRSEFERKLGTILTAARPADRKDSLLYLDLDGFKILNDTFGHPAGDKMLKQFASFLKCRFRETDTIGRIGGDRFGVLLENCTSWQARELVEKLYRDLRSFSFEWEETSLPVSLSTGILGLGADPIDVDKAMVAAESACYLAKQRGGDRYTEYEAKAVATSERQSQSEMLQRIQDCLREDLFELYAQRIEPLRPSATLPLMFEILLRMRDPEGEMVLPGRFIPLAERHRIVSAIDRWVLSRCFESLSQLDSGRPLRYSINISGQSLADERFLEFVLHELGFRGVDPTSIYFEITESATLSSFDKAKRFISVLKGRGCGFVLDDFGSGLSSFAYLRTFPVDFIKIDGQFIQGLCKDATHRALVESINHVGHVMDIRTIAEAVENQESLAAVRDLKVDYAQGNFLSRPMPLDQMLSDRSSSAASS